MVCDFDVLCEKTLISEWISFFEGGRVAKKFENYNGLYWWLHVEACDGPLAFLWMTIKENKKNYESIALKILKSWLTIRQYQLYAMNVLCLYLFYWLILKVCCGYQIWNYAGVRTTKYVCRWTGKARRGALPDGTSVCSDNSCEDQLTSFNQLPEQ